MSGEEKPYIFHTIWCHWWLKRDDRCTSYGVANYVAVWCLWARMSYYDMVLRDCKSMEICVRIRQIFHWNTEIRFLSLAALSICIFWSEVWWQWYFIVGRRLNSQSSTTLSLWGICNMAEIAGMVGVFKSLQSKIMTYLQDFNALKIDDSYTEYVISEQVWWQWQWCI